MQARFYLGAGEGAIVLPKPEPCSPHLWLQQQYAVVKPANT